MEESGACWKVQARTWAGAFCGMGFRGAEIFIQNRSVVEPGRAALRDTGCDPTPVPVVPAASTGTDRRGGLSAEPGRCDTL